MHATMEHWERPRCHTSRCIDACCDVTKRWRLLYWFVWGECPATLPVIYFMWLNVLAVKVLNKPIKYFCMHTSYITLVIQNGQTKLEALYFMQNITGNCLHDWLMCVVCMKHFDELWLTLKCIHVLFENICTVEPRLSKPLCPRVSEYVSR